MPIIPNEQSISCQKSGMPRILPAINANGRMAAQAIMPNCITHIFFTGCLNGPINTTANTKCAKASQSVP
ncbi:MAG: hypothetical protein ABIN95_08555 [Mucilaginibacter sp.]